MKFYINSIHPGSHMEVMWDFISKLSYQVSTSLARGQKNNFTGSGNCEEELPKKPVGQQVTDSLLTANQQVTDRLRKKKNCVKNEQLTWHNNP